MVTFRIDNEALDDFYVEVENGKRKATVARDIINEHFTKHKKIENEDNIYYPRDILISLYDNLDPKNIEKVTDTIVQMTMSKMKVKPEWNETVLVHSLKRWFTNNKINFDCPNEEGTGPIVLSSIHKMGNNFSTVTTKAIEKVLLKRNITCKIDSDKDFFKITIIRKN